MSGAVPAVNSCCAISLFLLVALCLAVGIAGPARGRASVRRVLPCSGVNLTR